MGRKFFFSVDSVLKNIEGTAIKIIDNHVFVYRIITIFVKKNIVVIFSLYRSHRLPRRLSGVKKAVLSTILDEKY